MISSLTSKLVLAARYLQKKTYRPAPTHLSLEVTKRCNAKCTFCDYWKEKVPEVEIDYSSLQKLIKPLVISITGGEPLLKQNLTSIIKDLRRNDSAVYILMITNGALLTYEKALELKKAGLNQLSISLDYLGEKHGQHRGIPGLYEKITKLLPQISKIGFDLVAFNTVIMDDNLGDIPKIVELAKKNKIQVSFSSFSDMKNNNQNLWVKPANLSKLTDLIAFLKKTKKENKRLIKSSNYYLDNVINYFTGKDIYNCPAGKFWILVTPDGKIKRCAEMDSACDVSEYTLKTFVPTKCIQCWYSCRGEAQCPINLDRLKDLVG